VGAVESWQEIDSSINGSCTNTTILRPISWNINGSATNTTVLQPISWTINGTATNTTVLQGISWNINGSCTNTTGLQEIDSSINGSCTNTSVESWQEIDSAINGSCTNISSVEIDSSINGTCTNTSVPAVITITAVFPSNNSVNIPLQPYVFATFSHQSGSVMNITWKNDTTTLGTENNVTNGTYNELFLNANSRSSDYILNITVNDGEGNWLNNTYNFETEGTPTGQRPTTLDNRYNIWNTRNSKHVPIE